MSDTDEVPLTREEVELARAWRTINGPPGPAAPAQPAQPAPPAPTPPAAPAVPEVQSPEALPAGILTAEQTKAALEADEQRRPAESYREQQEREKEFEQVIASADYHQKAAG